jgi:hypothetical protein
VDWYTKGTAEGSCSDCYFHCNSQIFIEGNHAFAGFFDGNWQGPGARVGPPRLVGRSADRIRGCRDFLHLDRQADLACRLGTRRRPRDLLFPGHQTAPAFFGDHQHRPQQDGSRQPARPLPSLVLFSEGYGNFGVGTKRSSLVCLPHGSVRVFPGFVLVGHFTFSGAAAILAVHGAGRMCGILGRDMGPPRAAGNIRGASCGFDDARWLRAFLRAIGPAPQPRMRRADDRDADRHGDQGNPAAAGLSDSNFL